MINLARNLLWANKYADFPHTHSIYTPSPKPHICIPFILTAYLSAFVMQLNGGGGEGERGVRVVYHMVLVYSFFPQRVGREGLKRGTLCNVITVDKFVVLLVLFVVLFDSWFGFFIESLVQYLSWKERSLKKEREVYEIEN
jgi:hypothetical protein